MLPFDTLKMRDRLEASGMPRQQADALVEVLLEVVSAAQGRFASMLSGQIVRAASTQAALPDGSSGIDGQPAWAAAMEGRIIAEIVHRIRFGDAGQRPLVGNP